MSKDKTAEDIHDRYCAGVPYQLGLREASINAMKAYSAQQLKEYRENLKKAMENKWSEYYITDPGATEAFPEVIKLIDQTDSTK